MYIYEYLSELQQYTILSNDNWLHGSTMLYYSCLALSCMHDHASLPSIWVLILTYDQVFYSYLDGILTAI